MGLAGSSIAGALGSLNRLDHQLDVIVVADRSMGAATARQCGMYSQARMLATVASQNNCYSAALTCPFKFGFSRLGIQFVCAGGLSVRFMGYTFIYGP